MINKRTVTTIVLSVLLVALIQSAVPLVSAQEPEPDILNVYPFAWFFPWELPPTPMPYVAGHDAGWYPPNGYGTTTKVEITVSFPDTSPSLIPTNNYIAGGMFLQGQGGAYHIDYGFLATLSLDRDGTLQYNMGFWKTHEPEFTIGAYCTVLWKKAVVLGGVDPSEPVTLIMQWNNGWVEWSYTIDRITHFADACNALGLAPTIIQKFYIGTYYGSETVGECYYYQFGIYSKTPIENSGWKVRLEDPLYYDTSENRWKPVSKAKAIEGYWGSYLDHWYRWGGESYPARGRYYENGLGEGCTIEFDWSSDLWLGDWLGKDHELLWDNPACVYVLAEDQNGYLLKNGNVYIDDQWRGYTSSRFDIATGTHTFRVDDVFWGAGQTGYRYGFTGWEDGSTSLTRTITVSGVTPITPRFFKKWCPGDVDGSGVVDDADQDIVSAAYGASGRVPLDPHWDSRADLTCDGWIGFFDMLLAAINYGKDYRLVGNWRFDEGSGSTAGDSSLYGNTGTIYGGTWTNGKGGYALSFDGINDYMDVSYSPSLDITNEMSIELWFNPTGLGSVAGHVMLVRKAEAYAVVYSSDNYGLDLRFGDTWYTDRAVGEFVYNNWYHLAVTFSFIENKIKIYKNGILIDTINHNGLLNSVNVDQLRIGSYYGGYFFEGIIDEVCIYNRALSAEEIDQIACEVVNGGFETGNALGWVTGGTGDHKVTNDDHYGGSSSMLIGYKDNGYSGRDWAYQIIAVPATATNVQLSFYYHLFTEDSRYYDWFEVYVRDSLGNNLALVFKKGGVDYPGLEEYGWAQATCDLSAYAGQTIQLYFAVKFDTLYKTWCYIDDVSVECQSTFGYEGAHLSWTHIENSIVGSWFTCPQNGKALAMSIRVARNSGEPSPVKCAIYRKSDGGFVAETEEIYVDYPGYWDPHWVTLEFVTPPDLSAGEDYWLVAWAGGDIYFYIGIQTWQSPKLGIQSLTYGNFPTTYSPNIYNYIVNIYCTVLST